MSKVKTNIGPLINSEGELTHDNKEMSNILAEQYSKVYSKPTHSFPDVPSKNINEPLEPLHLLPNNSLKQLMNFLVVQHLAQITSLLYFSKIVKQSLPNLFVNSGPLHFVKDMYHTN